jgi:adenosylhomocysteine nucleosidase
MPNKTKFAIIAALEREIRPLVTAWTVLTVEHEGRRFKIFESNDVVLVCGGIGVEAARRATEAVISLYRPELVASVGYAGALAPALHVGNILVPSYVIDLRDGSRMEISPGEGKLLSISGVAGINQKTMLADAYGAQAVDMEAAAVAKGALAHGIRFIAVKSISDEHDFAFPAIDQFVGHDGAFRTTKFAFFVAVRPRLWARALKLARNSFRAAKSLCQWLEVYLHDRKEPDNSRLRSHPREIAAS